MRSRLRLCIQAGTACLSAKSSTPLGPRPAAGRSWQCTNPSKVGSSFGTRSWYRECRRASKVDWLDRLKKRRSKSTICRGDSPLSSSTIGGSCAFRALDPQRASDRLRLTPCAPGQRMRVRQQCRKAACRVAVTGRGTAVAVGRAVQGRKDQGANPTRKLG